MLKRAGLVLISAAFTYLSFPNIFINEGLPGFAWAALVPFLWAIDGRPWRERLVLGALWGMAFFFFLTFWMNDVNLAGFLLFAAALSTAPVLFAVLSTSAPHPSWCRWLWGPALWAATEWLRSGLLGGFTWSLAYSQASVPVMIQGASVGGPYLVAAFIVLVNGIFYRAVRSSTGRVRLLGIGFGVVLAIGLAGFYLMRESPAAEHIKLALIQANITKMRKSALEQYDANIARHVALSRSAVLGSRPDLIVWPETAFADDVLKDVTWRPRMEQLALDLNAPILLGSALEQDGRSLNAALLLSSRGEWKEGYVKNKLVPFTEYLPTAPLIRPLADLIGVHPYDFIAGNSPGIFFVERSIRKRPMPLRSFGVVICSEEAYPGLFRSLARRNVGFVIVMLNDGWFRAPQALRLHAQNSAFRAVESGVPVVRAANTGETIAFDPSGRSIPGYYPKLQSAGAAVVDVPFSSRRTIYSIFGDIFAWLCCGFVIINIVFTLRTRFARAASS